VTGRPSPTASPPSTLPTLGPAPGAGTVTTREPLRGGD
jgi:hypothetical protein